MTRPFWETKTLEEMTDEEWESVCDGCGRCCLIKLEDEDNGDVFFTNVACQLLDGDSCRCTHYPDRLTYVPDCVVLDRGKLDTISWLPDTCAYRLLHEGSTLFSWHPLISGDADSVHRAGISVRGVTVSETEVAEEDLEDHVIHWVS